MATRVLPFTQVVTSSPPSTPDATGNKGRMSTLGGMNHAPARSTMDSNITAVTAVTAGSGEDRLASTMGQTALLTTQYDVDTRLSRVAPAPTPQHVPASNHRRAIRNDTQSKVLKAVITMRKEEPYLTTCSRKIVENKFFVAFTTVLTVYALVGDDLRILCTNKPADNIFNILTLTCLLIFTIEIVISCLGKTDYFLGFFFLLGCHLNSKLTPRPHLGL